ncbi:MAG: DUF5131 family protein, partial [Desulforhopalus sp.]
WNPWQGCRKESAGCLNCYMYREKTERWKQDPAIVIRSKDRTFNRPLHWHEPARVFVCSWSDFFIEDADEWRDEAWEVMRQCPHLTFQILTKRPQNIKARLPEDWLQFNNVWLGVTAENQAMADQRIPLLLSIPCDRRFLSIEPMLSPIDLYDYLGANRLWRMNQIEYAEIAHNYANCDCPRIHWIIVGGESGTEARPMDQDWAESIRVQCTAHHIPFFMKQMSGSTKKEREDIPAILRLRQFP